MNSRLAKCAKCAKCVFTAITLFDTLLVSIIDDVERALTRAARLLIDDVLFVCVYVCQGYVDQRS